MNDSDVKSLSNASQGTTDKSPAELDGSDPECFVFFKTYIDPAMYVVIIIIGLILNGTLLLIFARHREIRTTANIMILHLAICDVLNICINGPIHYVFPYYGYDIQNRFICGSLVVARQLLSCISALSLVALSIQRFCATFPRIHGIFLNNKCIIGLFVVLVWVLSLGMSLPPIFMEEVFEHFCSSYKNIEAARAMVLLSTISYCVVFLAFIVIFNLLTARRLRRSAQQIPGENLHKVKNSREKSANVMTSLCVLYIVSYVPHWVWCTVVYCYELNRHTGVVLFTEYLFKYLLFAHACFNPVALYISSSVFKKLFRRYMCCS